MKIIRAKAIFKKKHKVGGFIRPDFKTVGQQYQDSVVLVDRHADQQNMIESRNKIQIRMVNWFLAKAPRNLVENSLKQMVLAELNIHLGKKGTHLLDSRSVVASRQGPGLACRRVGSIFWR